MLGERETKFDTDVVVMMERARRKRKKEGKR